MSASTIFSQMGILGGHAKSIFNGVLGSAAKAMGNYWHTNYHPIHYTNRATLRYGYALRDGENVGGSNNQPDKGSYTWRKKLVKHHTRPLVWNGNARDTSLSGSVIPVTRGTGNPRVEIKVADIFNLPAAKNSSKSMLSEVSATIPAELDAMSNFLHMEMDRRLYKAKG